MRAARVFVVLAPWAAFAGACSSSAPGAPGATGTGVAVHVSALSLTGVKNACWSLTVTNQQGDVVAAANDVCADQFGDGTGAISWVGPCDADATGLPPGDTVNDNTVTLVLEDLYSADAAVPANAIARDEYVNPCGTSGGNWDGFGPCTRTVACRENADSAVDFDITLSRRAHQGFFDIAVEFEDVFCSAKLDCVGDPPGLVFDPVSGARVASFVLGFACTSGTSANGPEPTWMYLSDVTLACTGMPAVVLHPASVTADGNQGAAGVGVIQWMQMTGDEQIGGGDFDKCFWNLAGGLDLAALAGHDCHLTATGAASSSLWSGNVPPADHVVPVVTWDVPVLSGGALCQNNALDGAGSGVKTAYLGDAVGGSGAPSEIIAPLVAHRRCGPDDAPTGAVQCAGANDATFGPAALDDQGTTVPAVEVHLGAATGTFALPADDTYTVEGCCLDGCCTVR